MRSLIIQLVNRHSYFASTKWIYTGVLWDMIAAMVGLVQIHLILRYKFGLPRLALYILYTKNSFFKMQDKMDLRLHFVLRQREYHHFTFSLTIQFCYIRNFCWLEKWWWRYTWAEVGYLVTLRLKKIYNLYSIYLVKNAPMDIFI